MRNIIFGALVGVTVTFTTVAADINVADNGQTLTVDCAKDPNVSIAGNKATITLVGACEALSVDGNEAQISGSAKLVSVNGNDNIVKLDKVDVLGVNGNKNKISWKRPLTKKKPIIGNVGNGNKISRTK
jgi:hypothetical protein